MAFLRWLLKVVSVDNTLIYKLNLIEKDQGAALEKDIADFLERRGFEHYFTIYDELYDANGRFPAWGEGLWVKSVELKR